MTRKDILDLAGKCVLGDREEDYGSPEDNFRRIAALWNEYVKPRNVIFAPEDVAVMLILLKVARIAGGNPKDDNWIDIAGYAACGGEIQSIKD